MRLTRLKLPDENPTGYYRRQFEVPCEWIGRHITLILESVDAACSVWVNGQHVGYSEDSRLPAEFDVTRYVRAGANTIAVEVPRYCTGSYLEDQDFWHLSGIQRDVYLCALPPVHIRDYNVHTVLDAAYSDAELELTVFISETADMAQFRIGVHLFDGSGNEVLPEMAVARVSAASPMYGDTCPERGGLGDRFGFPAPQMVC